jgi:hypothetical protein
METQQSISDWADETFGVPENNISGVVRANKEMSELLSALAEDDNHPKTGEEIADIYIVLCRVAQRRGLSITDEVDRKMAINRRRKWKLDGKGHGQHVKE